jgi:hypothetical protein
LQGMRELCTGEIIGPGEYVYEPAENIDWWRAVGNEPLIVLVTIFGEVNYLAQDHRVLCNRKCQHPVRSLPTALPKTRHYCT